MSDELRAQRQAELRQRLTPPMLPIVIADDKQITKPKSQLTASAKATAQVTQSGLTIPGSASHSAEPELISAHAQETMATLDAFRAALNKTVGPNRAGKVMAASFREP